MESHRETLGNAQIECDNLRLCLEISVKPTLSRVSHVSKDSEYSWALFGMIHQQLEDVFEHYKR